MKPAAALALLLASLCVPAASHGQPDLRALALSWSMGEFAAPLVCELGGDPRRGLRRLKIEPKRSHGDPANRLRFFDLALPPGTRCHDDMGSPQPNAIGTLEFTLEGHSRSDIADRDFAEALERKGGFEFRVGSGSLRVSEPGGPADVLRAVDFRGGVVRLTRIARGTDADRRMADFRQGRRLQLHVEAKDGTRLDLDLVMVGE